MARPTQLGGRWSYVVLAVVIAVALAIGSRHSGAPSEAQRITHLESVIKCPDCADLTIGQSTTELAGGLRTLVAELVHEGKTDAEIEQVVVAKDGRTEILTPNGVSGWIAIGVPVGAFLIALALLVATLARHRGSGRNHDGPNESDLALVAAAMRDRRKAP